MICEKGLQKPSADEWLKEAKISENAGKIGMYLVHNGVVRETSKKDIYEPGTDGRKVVAMEFSADLGKAQSVIDEGLRLPGIYYVRVWIAEGKLSVGDDIMQVLIGADCRPNCVNALNTIVGRLKSECVSEKEIFE